MHKHTMYNCTNVQFVCFILCISKIRDKFPMYNSIRPCTIDPFCFIFSLPEGIIFRTKMLF